LNLSTRASSNSLSAPIKYSGGFRDSLDDKSKANLVQKGRFSVTSGNVDLAKDVPLSIVPRRSPQATPLRKSASVGNWILEPKMVSLRSQSVLQVIHFCILILVLFLSCSQQLSLRRSRSIVAILRLPHPSCLNFNIYSSKTQYNRILL
jgi:hypothetical protein